MPDPENEDSGVYSYNVQIGGGEAPVVPSSVANEIEIQTKLAHLEIIRSQANINNANAQQIHMNRFLNMLGEIRMALASAQIDNDGKVVEKMDGQSIIPVKSMFLDDVERARLAQLYGRVIDGAVAYTLQLDPRKKKDDASK